jgi:GDPmannose 4,6-dehydratase
VRHYRRAYNLFCSNGILFNHTGEKRGSAFVEAKIVKQAVMIKLGLLKTMELGNLKASRDIGASKDYVKAMYLIVNHEKADDFVISTGVTHTIEDICRYVFSKLDLNWENHVVINDKYLRQEELPFLKGDSSKARSILGWKPTYTFEAIMDEMISYQFNLQ